MGACRGCEFAGEGLIIEATSQGARRTPMAVCRRCVQGGTGSKQAMGVCSRRVCAGDGWLRGKAYEFKHYPWAGGKHIWGLQAMGARRRGE